MSNLIPVERIENKILLMRGIKVMLDRDLAELYGVPTKRLNEQVKRNIKRFPDDFMFQLTRMETEYLVSQDVIPLRSQIATPNAEKAKNKGKITNLKSQFVTSSRGGRRYLPYVFTEQGVAMLSSVLKSERAIEMNIIIMRAFVKIRNLIYSYKDLAEKMEKMERAHNKHSQQIGKIFEILDKLIKTESEERQEIGFKGQFIMYVRLPRPLTPKRSDGGRASSLGYELLAMTDV